MLWDLSYSRILSIDSFAKFFIRVCSFHHLYGLAVIPHDHFEIQRPSESWAAGLRQYVYLDSLDVAPPPPRSCANRSVVFSLGIRCFLRLLAAEFRCNIFQFTLSSKPSSVSAPLGVIPSLRKVCPRWLVQELPIGLPPLRFSAYSTRGAMELKQAKLISGINKDPLPELGQDLLPIVKQALQENPIESGGTIDSSDIISQAWLIMPSRPFVPDMLKNAFRPLQFSINEDI